MKILKLLKEGEGVDKMRFSVTFMFNTEETGKMDPHRIEMDIQEMLDDVIERGGEKLEDYGVDDIVVQRIG